MIGFFHKPVRYESQAHGKKFVQLTGRPFKTSLSYESALLSSPEELKCELGRWFWRRDRVPGKDFCWIRPVILDDDRTLESILPISTYREHRYVLPCCSMLCPFSPPSQRQLLHWKIESIKIFSIIVYNKGKIDR
jgi:hypothetical protein